MCNVGDASVLASMRGSWSGRGLGDVDAGAGGLALEVLLELNEHGDVS
jgi:hypothetical protein